MKRIFGLLSVLLLTSLQSMAANKGFDLKMELQFDQDQPVNARVIAVEGEKATITQELDGKKTFIEVIASERQTPDGTPGVLMQLAVGKIHADGTRKVVSRPQVLAKYNQRAEIRVGDEQSPEAVRLSVEASAKTL